MNYKDYTKTSDTPFAAYLMLQGYTVLGCVDPGNTDGRYDFYFTHSSPEIRDNIDDKTTELRDRYQYESIGYREFYLNLKTLRRMTRNPIRKSDFDLGGAE